MMSFIMMNLYAVLSVAPEADEAEIKAAFRQLAKVFHPDVSGGDSWSEQQFKAVHHAYRILCDPEKRGVYDTELANARAAARRRFRCGVATMAATFLVTVGAGAMLVFFGQIGPISDAEVHSGALQPSLDNPAAESLPASASATGWTTDGEERASLEPAQKHVKADSKPSLDPLDERAVREVVSASSTEANEPQEPSAPWLPNSGRDQHSKAERHPEEHHASSELGVPEPVLSTTEELTEYVLQIFLRDREKFADRVAFYHQGVVSRDVVLRSKALYASRWPWREYKLIPGSLAIRATGRERFEIEFAFDYAVASVRRRAVGVARTKVGLLKSSRELIVTAVQEAVQRR